MCLEMPGRKLVNRLLISDWVRIPNIEGHLRLTRQWRFLQDACGNLQVSKRRANEDASNAHKTPSIEIITEKNFRAYGENLFLNSAIWRLPSMRSRSNYNASRSASTPSLQLLPQMARFLSSQAKPRPVRVFGTELASVLHGSTTPA